jgi:hypothetical protein
MKEINSAETNRAKAPDYKESDPAKKLCGELMANIFERLNQKDLMNSSRVNKDWYAAANDNNAWRQAVLRDKRNISIGFLNKTIMEGKSIRKELFCMGINKEIRRTEEKIRGLAANENYPRAQNTMNPINVVGPLGVFATAPADVMPIGNGICSFFKSLSDASKLKKHQARLENLQSEKSKYLFSSEEARSSTCSDVKNKKNP